MFPVTRGRSRSRSRSRISKSERVARAVGEAPKHNQLKKCQVAGNATIAKASRTLYETALVDMLKQSTSEEIDRRDRDRCHVLGFHLNFQLSSNQGSPQTFSYAVIASKNSNTSTVSTTGFFRDFGFLRTQNFAPAMNSLQFAQYPINTDNWRVLGKWNVKINGTLDTAGGAPDAMISRKVKFDRQITYSGSPDAPNTNVFVVYWTDVYGSTAGFPAIANCLSVIQSHVTFFSDEPTKNKKFGITIS